MTERYPTLRAFARGYLHEDFEAEHGTPRAALEAFLAAASPTQRRTLAREAARLDLADRRLAGRPGAGAPPGRAACAWWPARASEVRALLDEAVSPSPRA